MTPLLTALATSLLLTIFQVGIVVHQYLDKESDFNIIDCIPFMLLTCYTWQCALETQG